jgi:hypothetical protein
MKPRDNNPMSWEKIKNIEIDELFINILINELQDANIILVEQR